MGKGFGLTKHANTAIAPRRIASIGLTACCCVLGAIIALAQQPVTLTVRVDQPGPKIDPIFYGLMTEEINFSYDGGLYAELIRNRTMRDDAQNPVHWWWSIIVEEQGRSLSKTIRCRIRR